MHRVMHWDWGWPDGRAQAAHTLRRPAAAISRPGNRPSTDPRCYCQAHAQGECSACSEGFAAQRVYARGHWRSSVHCCRYGARSRRAWDRIFIDVRSDTVAVDSRNPKCQPKSLCVSGRYDCESNCRCPFAPIPSPGSAVDTISLFLMGLWRVQSIQCGLSGRVCVYE